MQRRELIDRLKDIRDDAQMSNVPDVRAAAEIVDLIVASLHEPTRTEQLLATVKPAN